MTRVGFLLSGAGFQDGTEIQEAVVAMLALEESGAELLFIAPDLEQARVVNHANDQTATEKRNVLVESSRITRGNIRSLASVNERELDALVMPGGFGAALNLSDFGTRGAAMTVVPELASLVVAMHRARKPMGAICIAPVILAKVLGSSRPRLTTGHDPESMGAMREMGAEAVACDVSDIVVDEKNLLVSTPAYMLASSVKDLHRGIRRLCEQVVRMAGSKNQA